MGLYDWKVDLQDTRVNRIEGSIPNKWRGTIVRRSGKTTALDPAFVSSDGSIDLASGAYSARGSNAVAVTDGTFGFTATTTSITIYWDGTNGSIPFKIRRSDSQSQSGNSTCTVVPSGSVTITGLSASTKYYFLPFYGVFSCGVGWVIGNAGNIKIAFSSLPGAQYTALQVLKNREPLSSGPINYTTPGAGSSAGTVGSGGSTGAGGGSTCVMAGTAIDPIGFSNYSVATLPEENWIQVSTDTLHLNCTLNHPLYRDDDRRGLSALMQRRNLDSLTEEELAPWRVEAGSLMAGDMVLTKFGLKEVVVAEPFVSQGAKRSVHMDSGHLFWANNFLSHNVKASTE